MDCLRVCPVLTFPAYVEGASFSLLNLSDLAWPFDHAVMSQVPYGAIGLHFFVGTWLANRVLQWIVLVLIRSIRVALFAWLQLQRLLTGESAD